MNLISFQTTPSLTLSSLNNLLSFKILHLFILIFLLKYKFTGNCKNVPGGPVYPSDKSTNLINYSNDNILHNSSTISKWGNWDWYNPGLILTSPVLCAVICVCACICIVLCNFITCVDASNYYHYKTQITP